MLACIALLTMTQWPEKEWAFKPVEAGHRSAIQEQAVFVLRSEAEMQTYLAKRGDTGKPMPKIDWRANQVLAIHLGQRPSAGYSVEVKHLWKAPVGALAEILETKPGPDMVTASVLTYPYVIVRTERFAGKVELKK